MLNPDIENNHYIFITPQQEDANLLDITTMFPFIDVKLSFLYFTSVDNVGSYLGIPSVVT